tara:strand:- start:2727 stop:3290 length:564 start_codon:yes stop_codon:yes gene_type:complete
MSYRILEETNIDDIIKKSSLDSHTSQQTKRKLEIIGADTAADLFENYDEVDININIINELREIAYNEYYKHSKTKLTGKHSPIFVEFTSIIKVEKLKNARKRLAFAKLSQERLSLNSLLNDINIDLLNKIGEILLEFLNFRYFPKKNKKIGGGKRRKNHKKKKSKNKHKQRSKTKKNRKYKSRRRRR